MIWTVIALFALVGVLNVLVTAKILRSEFLLTRQRVFQLLFVWLVPVVGSVVCLVVIASDENNHGDKNSGSADLEWDVVPTRPGIPDGH